MGWASGGDIFDPVADKLIDLGVEDQIKTQVLSTLIECLRNRDWDTEEESLGSYDDDPAIVEAFRRNGIVLRCAEEGGPDGDWWCEKVRHHASDHEDYLGRKWPNGV